MIYFDISEIIFFENGPFVQKRRMDKHRNIFMCKTGRVIILVYDRKAFKNTNKVVAVMWQNV